MFLFFIIIFISFYFITSFKHFITNKFQTRHVLGQRFLYRKMLKKI